MRRVLQLCLLTATALGTFIKAHGQAVPTASRAGIAQFGAGWTLAKPDYDRSNIQGLSLYGSFDFTRHWGIEGDIHLANTVTPTNIGQSSYLIGPRYVIRHNRFNPYAKALLGFGRFTYKFDKGSDATYTYKIYAFGGGLDYDLTRHINLRAVDFEYQRWPGFPTSGLTPLVFTFGAAYSFR